MLNSPRAYIVGALIVSAAWPVSAVVAAIEPEHVGTFVYIDEKVETSGFYMVLQTEQKGAVVQIIGRSMHSGKPAAELKGTYYPRSNEFRGTSRHLSEPDGKEDFDGRFHVGSKSFEFWIKGNPRANFFAKKLDAREVVGDYVGGTMHVSISKQGSGFAVGGSHGDYPIRGSYLSRSNEIAARVANYTLDGIFDPYSKGIFVWLKPTSGVRTSNPGFFLLKGTPPRTTSTNPLDPAIRPGAIWRQRETYQSEISGTWTLRADGRTFDAKWTNGASATLTLTSFSNTEIVVARNDLEGTSKGLKATYKGKVTGRRVAGDVDWTWASGKKGTGKWSADLP